MWAHIFPLDFSGGVMSIRTLISDINAAVEWWTDYQEDNQAGEECIPFDCITCLLYTSPSPRD